ncbi:hypothetical protein B7435_29335 [Mycolicibacterium peregrinum]|nr:DUF4333 domain-containing protein [Mycolicibacterium alvei]OWL96011.1 hypothetical protein B7435_29335 [Mycolicibacterium peregrinum]
MVLGAAALMMAGVSAACTAHIEAGSRSAAVSSDKLAATVEERLKAHTGKEADSVECDGELPAKVGATQRCTLTDGAMEYGVTVTTTSADNGTVKFDIKVDDHPVR